MNIHLRIGKQGITPHIIEEITTQLQTIDPYTIKFLQNFRENNDRKEAAKEITEKTNSQILTFVGGKLTITRKPLKTHKGGNT